MSFVRATSLAIGVVLGLCGAAPAVAAPADPPAGTSLSVHADTLRASAGSVVRITGTLVDADRQPVAGAPIDVDVTSAGVSTGDSGSTTLAQGRFEAYAPVPEQAPASGTVQIVVRFPGTADALPAEASLTVPVEAAPAPAGEALVAGHPNATKKPSPKPSASAPSVSTSASTSPTGSPATAAGEDPMLRTLLLAAGGLLGLLVLLIGVGAFLHRRRSR